MPKALKDLYDSVYFNELVFLIHQEYQDFKCNDFLNEVLNNTWEQMELKERMRHIANTLRVFLPGDIGITFQIISKVITRAKEIHGGMSLEYMFVPEIIAKFGISHFDLSILAMESITRFASCEFAIRPFIMRYPDKTMKRMEEWSKHEDLSVRRFSSEGCRPRLPWAMSLPIFKDNPSPIIPILENLKNDPSEFVRKSVANNLNDISKDNPDVTLELSHKWIGKNPDTDWVVKHGCRTLLKAGNLQA